MGPDVQKRIAGIEKDLLPRGFRHVADIVCLPLKAILVRAYAQERGTVWAALLASSYAAGTFELVSTFAGGASLTTTTNAMTRDVLYRDSYRSVHQHGEPLALLADHERRAAHLAKFHGAASTLNATPAGLAAAVEAAMQQQEGSKPAPGKKPLLKADGNTYFSADARAIDPDVPALIDDADARMAALGFSPAGDVVGSLFTDLLWRGYARGRGDVWALLQINASTVRPPQGAWDFVTAFTKGAVLSSTRGALSKDEPKRKIFRILDAEATAEQLLARHDARKAELARKWGAPLPVSATMKDLAQQAADSIARIIG
jgi:hypothetical protein